VPIGAPDLPIDAAAGNDVTRAAPVAPLQPGLVINRKLDTADPVQKFVGQAGVALTLFGQGGHRAVQNNDMRHRSALTNLSSLVLAHFGPHQIVNSFEPGFQ